jgi:hypothetical protein
MVVDISSEDDDRVLERISEFVDVLLIKAAAGLMTDVPEVVEAPAAACSLELKELDAETTF